MFVQRPVDRLDAVRDLQGLHEVAVRAAPACCVERRTRQRLVAAGRSPLQPEPQD